MPLPHSYRSFSSLRAFVSCASLASLAAFAGYCAMGTTAASVASVAVPGCTLSDDAGYEIITGVIVRASTLVAGLGCGGGANEIYKYSVVVTTSPEAGAPQFVAGGTFDCFTDATFVNLCTNFGGNFDVNVYAYTEAAWNAAGGTGAAVQSKLGTDPSACDSPEAAAATGPGEVEATLQATASYTTTCTATQQLDAEVLAVCQPVTATR